jgi:hypothetical protein
MLCYVRLYVQPRFNIQPPELIFYVDLPTNNFLLAGGLAHLSSRHIEWIASRGFGIARRGFGKCLEG